MLGSGTASVTPGGDPKSQCHFSNRLGRGLCRESVHLQTRSDRKLKFCLGQYHSGPGSSVPQYYYFERRSRDCYLNHGRGPTVLTNSVLKSHGENPVSVIVVHCCRRLRRFFLMASLGMVQDSILRVERHPWSRYRTPLLRFVLLIHEFLLSFLLSFRQVTWINPAKAKPESWTSYGANSSVGSCA